MPDTCTNGGRPPTSGPRPGPLTERAPGPVILGLDVGTTSAKAAAFTPGSTWHRVAIHEYPLLETEHGQWVQDAATIVAGARAALAECVAATAGSEILAVAVSASMHGLMAIDADHRPLTPLITWADGRARAEARRLHESGEALALHAETGVPVHPMTPMTKLMWFAEHDAATCKAARWWVGVKEYVLLWLTGTVVTEASSASGTGLVGLRSGAWHPHALDLCGVDVERLPAILPTTATLPLDARAARDVGLPSGTPVVVGAADGPLGNVGTGAIAPGVAGLTLGTSGAVRMAVGAPIVDAAGGLFCYALTDAVWVVGGAISNGAGVMRWALSGLAPDLRQAPGGGDEALLALAGTVAPGSDGLVMLPYLLPERAPWWDPDLPGAYLGLRASHTRAHLVRAALEGVCLQTRLILDSLDALDPVTSVRATGGAFRSSLWAEVMAAAIGRPLAIVGRAEGTALGAAALGLYALGRAETLADGVARLSGDGPPTRPVEPAAELVAAYARTRASVPALLAALDRVVPTYRAERGASSW